MKLFHLTAVAATWAVATATVGKSTYAMSHPFAYKAWMETYLPTQENIVQKNSTATCNEWVKLCIDDGSGAACSGPRGNTQLHSVGAYERYSGAKTLETMEGEFTSAMGGMKQYDPFMELHAMFMTKDLDSYVSSFKAGGVPTFASSFTQQGKTYYSILVQVDGSLKAGAGSMLLLEIVGTSSALLSADSNLFHHDVPRASAASLERAVASAAMTAPVVASASATPPTLTMMHVSFPSSNVTREAHYFESVLGGTKTSEESGNGTQVYTGTIFDGDTVEIRYVQSSMASQGPVTVAAWESYASSLHKECIPAPNYDNQGFDRLADNHIGGHGNQGMGDLSALIEAQIAAGLPYRVYSPPNGGTRPAFLYLYGHQGWGYQITGSCTDAKACKNLVFYDMCTQGVGGASHCKTDMPTTTFLDTVQ